MVLQDAETYLKQIIESIEVLESDDVQCIVLAGHSQGAVVAEAVAYLLAMDEEMYTRVGHKVFVVNAGAHLWMTADMRDVITQNYAQRFASFVTKINNMLDTFAIRYDAYEPETLVSLPKLVVNPDGSIAKVDTMTVFTKAGTTTDPFLLQELHFWSTYEAMIKETLKKHDVKLSSATRATDYTELARGAEESDETRVKRIMAVINAQRSAVSQLNSSVPSEPTVMDEQDYYRQALKHAAMLVEALKGMIATTAGHDDDWVREHLGTDKSSFIKQMTHAIDMRTGITERMESLDTLPGEVSGGTVSKVHVAKWVGLLMMTVLATVTGSL
jgi:hypothetical protein